MSKHKETYILFCKLQVSIPETNNINFFKKCLTKLDIALNYRFIT